MEEDPQLKLLILLEGRRIMKDGPLLMLTGLKSCEAHCTL